MKKRFRHRLRLSGILFSFAIAIGFTAFTIAAQKKEARVTQVVHDVQLLASQAAPRPAAVSDYVREGTALRTGDDSRAELTFSDQTLARLGANTVLSFGEGDFDLASGAILLCVPRSSGGTRINTAVATAEATSFTALLGYDANTWLKFIILEGHGSISLRHHPGETRELHAGQMIIVRPGVMKLPEPEDVDLSRLIKTSLLITRFPPLPSLDLILLEAKNQQTLLPSGLLIDPTSLDTLDQKAAAEPLATPKPKPTG